MLEAAATRQLTLNANVWQFAYQPGGLEIAYTGMQVDGTKVTQSLRLIGSKHGGMLGTLRSHTWQLNEAGTEPVRDGTGLMRLCGWSGDGRYLLVTQYSLATQNYLCIDVGQETIHITPIALPANQNPAQGFVNWYWWSPNRSRILVSQLVDVHDETSLIPPTRSRLFMILRKIA